MKQNKEDQFDPLEIKDKFKSEIDYSKMSEKMDNTIQPLDGPVDDLNERQENYVRNNQDYFINRIKIPDVPGLTQHKRGIPTTARWYTKMTSLQKNGNFIPWTRKTNIFLVCGLFFSMVVFGNVQHVMNGRYYAEFATPYDFNFIIYEKLYNRPLSQQRVWTRPA